MTPPLPDRLAFRASVLRAVRAWFDGAGFVEVATPVRIPCPANEEYIDAIPSGDHWLRTSPELHMKRLLAGGARRIYQIGPCFRAGERGPIHREEFTMLEWYRAPGDAEAILGDTLDLLNALPVTPGGERAGLVRPPEVLTVREAFLRFAEWDPVAAFDPDRFDLDLADRVEPALPRDRPVVLTRYPAARAALARKAEDDPAEAERWELYLGGMEIANAYTELTDPAEQRARFIEAARFRADHGRQAYPVDEPFLAALDTGLPPCGGIALGLDRLIMILAGVDTLDDLDIPGNPSCAPENLRGH